MKKKVILLKKWRFSEWTGSQWLDWRISEPEVKVIGRHPNQRIILKAVLLDK